MIWQSDININETETQCVNNTDPLPCSVNNPCNNGGTCMNGEESVANVLLSPPSQYSKLYVFNCKKVKQSLSQCYKSLQMKRKC